MPFHLPNNYFEKLFFFLNKQENKTSVLRWAWLQNSFICNLSQYFVQKLRTATEKERVDWAQLYFKREQFRNASVQLLNSSSFWRLNCAMYGIAPCTLRTAPCTEITKLANGNRFIILPIDFQQYKDKKARERENFFNSKVKGLHHYDSFQCIKIFLKISDISPSTGGD